MQRVIDTVSNNDASDGVTDGLIGAAIFIFGGLMVGPIFSHRRIGRC